MDDLIVEDGATHAFSKKGAQVLDVRQVTLTNEKQAIVDVQLRATTMDAKVCRYLLTRAAKEWRVSEKDTGCTV